ncbi:hypothetical protein SAMN06265173_12655 [Thalassovita litoralis]|uniref:DUF4376 domain-containing protein n=1 Tax=Thalassovita litoralis TaxID=1010611 RepID=A0A521FDY1_9RHOB|nr:hypothetical protein [Thalassovita litoralis]SMO93851.1 hypothetical protein SAMN06265173_12655 [Thalassovita litoralis]
MFYDPLTATLYRTGRDAMILGLTEQTCRNHGLEPVTLLPRPQTSGAQIATRNLTPHEEGGQWVLGWTIGTIPATAEMVEQERDRRLALGFDFDFQDTRGVHHIGTSKEDMIGWDEVTTWSQAMINLGNATSTTMIKTDTGLVQIAASEWQQVLAAAAAFRQPIWGASFAIKAMEPIPPDYADDQHWP